jgi:hypothetical protein
MRGVGIGIGLGVGWPTGLPVPFPDAQHRLVTTEFSSALCSRGDRT